jgi:hypothetical protein
MALFNRKNTVKATEDEEVTPASTDVSEVEELCDNCLSDIDEALSLVDDAESEYDKAEAEREYADWFAENPKPPRVIFNTTDDEYDQFRKERDEWRAKYNTWRETHMAKYPSFWACTCG